MNNNITIPKVIHYCWFGGNPLPPLAIKCIDSWKKFFPDYEIKEWNENNFNVNIIPYTAQAYEEKKYAYVSDFARFWILYHYGGIYFDTDVEVIKCMDDIISSGPFMGCENEYQVTTSLDQYSHDSGIGLGVNPGLGLGVNPGHILFKRLLDLYATLSFKRADGSINYDTIVVHTTQLLCNFGLIGTNQIQKCEGVSIYPKEYFCPIDYTTKQLVITPNTRTIHHYCGSWQSHSTKLKSIFNAKHPQIMRALIIFKHLLNGTRPL